MTLDKYTYGQLVGLTILMAAIILVFGFSLSSCIGDRSVSARYCPDGKPCTVVTVKFINLPSVPGDTLNVTAERIIESITRGSTK